MSSHTHEHIHEHTHTDGHTHTHEHAHTHTHDHAHNHAHSHSHASDGAPMDVAKRKAMLAYLLEHNRHHAQEIHDLAHGCDEAAAALLHEASALIDQGNDKIEAALALMEEV